jgi:broad specificity phosphatase PhoE
MVSLTLVRHGQASFLSGHYDRLSPAGERQARALGDYWAALGVEFDRVIYGPAERHRASGEAVREAYRVAGREFPDAETMPEFDEFAWLEVIEHLVPALAASDPRVRDLAAAYRQAAGSAEEAAHFDRLFREVMPHYLSGTVSHERVESWAAFGERVERGLARILDGPAQRPVVFTSAGTIAAAGALALDLTPLNTIKLTMAIRNGSWSDFRFRNGAGSSERLFLLSTLNCAPHLASAPELQTYR